MSRIPGVPCLRTAKAVRSLIEQRIALGHAHDRIARDLNLTVEQVDRVRAEMDELVASDEPGNCNRCGQPVRAVPVHHASGRATVHRTCSNGHPHRKSAPNGRRLSVVRGER